MAITGSGLSINFTAPIVVTQSYDAGLDAVIYSFSASITEAYITLADVTTGNSTTGRHGFLPKLDGNSAHYLDGTGAWSTPPTPPTPDPANDIRVWMPLTTVVGGVPDLVWSGDNNLIPTCGPI